MYISLRRILDLSFYFNNNFKFVSRLIVLEKGVYFAIYQRYFVYLQTNLSYLKEGGKTHTFVYFMPE